MILNRAKFADNRFGCQFPGEANIALRVLAIILHTHTHHSDKQTQVAYIIALIYSLVYSHLLESTHTTSADTNTYLFKNRDQKGKGKPQCLRKIACMVTFFVLVCRPWWSERVITWALLFPPPRKGVHGPAANAPAPPPRAVSPKKSLVITCTCCYCECNIDVYNQLTCKHAGVETTHAHTPHVHIQ